MVGKTCHVTEIPIDSSSNAQAGHVSGAEPPRSRYHFIAPPLVTAIHQFEAAPLSPIFQLSSWDECKSTWSKSWENLLLFPTVAPQPRQINLLLSLIGLNTQNSGITTWHVAASVSVPRWKCGIEGKSCVCRFAYRIKGTYKRQIWSHG